MPGFDRTGPSGLGQRTGRGMGPCGRGLGFRRGYGRGMGFGRGFVGGFGRFLGYDPYQAGITKESELEILEDEARELERELESVRGRMKKLRGE